MGGLPVLARLYVGAVVALGTATMVAAVLSAAPAGPPAWGELALLWGLTLLTELLAVPLPRGGELVASTILHLALILVLPLPWPVVLAVGGTLVAEVIARRVWYRLLFNMGQIALAVGLPSLALAHSGYQALLFQPGYDGLSLLLVVLVVAGYYILNSGLTSTVLALVSHSPPWQVWWANHHAIVLPNLGLATIGALLAYLWRTNPFWSTLTLVPAAITYLCFRYIRSLEDHAAHNAHLLAETRRKADDLAHLYTASTLLTATLETAAVARIAVDQLSTRLPEGTTVALGVVEGDCPRLVLLESRGPAAPALTGRTLPLTLLTALSAGQPVDPPLDPALRGQPLLGLPLVVKEKIVGGLLIAGPGATLSPDQSQVIAIFAHQVAAALENSRLYSHEVRERQRMASLALAGQRFTASLEIEAVGTAIAATLAEASGGLALLVLTAPQPEAVRCYLAPADHPLATWLRTAYRPEVVLTRWSSGDWPVEPRRRTLPYGETAVPVVEIGLRGRAPALLVVAPPSGGFADEADRQFLQALADRAGAALENAVLFQEVGQIEALRELDRLKTEFLSLVSHELRTPLTLVVGYSELLAKTAPSPAETRWMAERVLEAGLHLSKIVDDLLDISRIESGRLVLERTETRLEDLVTTVVEEFRLSATQHDIVAVIAPDLPTLWLDPRRIRQVLYNLLANAVRYSPDGGQITVSVARSTDDGEPGVVVAVRDQGIGIPADKLSRIFEKFYRLPTAGRQSRGLGLGLAICKQLVEAHGGRIWVESVEGKGSTFFFKLPLRAPEEKIDARETARR